MLRKHFKKGLSSFVVGMLLSVGLTAAIAGDAYGTKTNYGPVFGKGYFNQASIYTSSTYAQARCLAESRSGTVPAGYMGVKPYLYNAAGTLISTGSTSYNSSACVSTDVPAPITTTRGNYYGKGQAAAWNGTTYVWYISTPSPNQGF